MEPIINPPKNSALYFFPYLYKNIIIIHAPNPYIAQNGPYKKLCLLSHTPFVAIPNIVSIIYPKKLYIMKYAKILHIDIPIIVGVFFFFSIFTFSFLHVLTYILYLFLWLVL